MGWAGLCGLAFPLGSAFMDLSQTPGVSFSLLFNYHPWLTVLGKLKLEAAPEVSSTVALQSVGADVRMSFCYVQFIIFPPHFLFYSRLVHCLSL